MQDRFEATGRGLDPPAIQPSPSRLTTMPTLAEVTRALYLRALGSLSLVTLSVATVTFAGLGVGTILPMRARRIRATGTTVTAIIGLV